MSDALAMHVLALDEFGSRVRAVREGGWHRPTPCTEWDVSDLVGHLVGEQLWVPPLLDGATVEEVGDRFSGDVLGDDPAAAWEAAAAGARRAFSAPGALERTVHLSYGDSGARDYLWEMTADLTVHAWDLARGIGAGEHLDRRLVEAVLARTEPRAAGMAESGLFDPPVAVEGDADPQTRLIALFGRRP